jgi:hypothetical protein
MLRAKHAGNVQKLGIEAECLEEVARIVGQAGAFG